MLFAPFRAEHHAAHLFFVCCCPGLKAGLDCCLEKLFQLFQTSDGPLSLLDWEIQPHTPLPLSCIKIIAQCVKHLYSRHGVSALLAAVAVGLHCQSGFGPHALVTHWCCQCIMPVWIDAGVCAGACSPTICTLVHEWPNRPRDWLGNLMHHAKL